jgi:biopolymer transport protein ExbD
MSKKKTFLRRAPPSGDVALQITSMADIFMILLVFLLKNYATSVSNVAPAAQLSLPELSQPKGVIKETIKVEIADNVVIVDQKPALQLHNFAFDPSEELGVAGSSPTILKLLNEKRKLQPDTEPEVSLLIMADEKTPYSTLKRVVASASGAGYVNLQLVVIQAE